MTLQEAVRRLRVELDISQTELAKRLEVNYSTISRWEHGQSYPKRQIASNVIKRVKAMQVSAECKKNLEDVMMPSRRATKSAADYGFPDVDQELLCQMVDGAMNAVCILDVNSRDVIYVNKMCEEMFHFRFVDLDERKCYQVFKNKNGPCQNCDCLKLQADNKSNNIIYSEIDNRVFKVLGREIEWKKRKLYLGYITDVLHRRDPVGKLFDQLPCGAGIYNMYYDGKLELEYMNDGFYEMLHTTREECGIVDGISQLNAVLPEERENLKQLLVDAARAGKPVNMEYHITVNQIDYHSLIAKCIPMKKDNEKVTYYCSFTNLDGLERI